MAQEAEFDDTERRALFGTHATEYSDGRPGYPTEVFEHLRSACGLGPGSRVLEIGPGAGQATGPLLDAGADVLAIEVGAAFEAMLTERFPGRQLEVRLGEFETVDLPAETFDLVVAATSFHWIDPQAGLERVANVLRPGGAIALWWTHFGDPDRADPFRDTVQPIFERLAPELADAVVGGAGIGAHPYALDVDARLAEIDGNADLAPGEHVLIPWTTAQTTDEMQRFLSSFSSWMTLDSAVRTELLDAIGELIDTTFDGAVERPFVTAVYTARRRGH